MDDNIELDHPDCIHSLKIWDNNYQPYIDYKEGICSDRCHWVGETQVTSQQFEQVRILLIFIILFKYNSL